MDCLYPPNSHTGEKSPRWEYGRDYGRGHWDAIQSLVEMSCTGDCIIIKPIRRNGLWTRTWVFFWAVNAQNLRSPVFKTLGNKSLFLVSHTVYVASLWQLEPIKIMSKQEITQSYPRVKSFLKFLRNSFLHVNYMMANHMCQFGYDTGGHTVWHVCEDAHVRVAFAWADWHAFPNVDRQYPVHWQTHNTNS